MKPKLSRTALILFLALLALCTVRSSGQDVVHLFPDQSLAGAHGGPAGVSRAGDDVDVSNLAGNEAEVTIDVNPTNPDNQVIVGYSPSFLPMNTFHTFDGGSSWTLVQINDAQDGLVATLRGDPTVAFDDEGILYVGYGVRQAGPNRLTVVVAKSTNGGQNYGQFTYVSTQIDVNSIPGNDKWHLATGPDPTVPDRQNVYIAFTQSVQEESGIDQRIVFSRSTDRGATFSAPIVINDASISGTSPGNIFVDPAVGPGGEVYVAWWNVNTTQVFVDGSLDGGLTFGTDVVVTTSDTGFKTSIPAQPDRGVFVGPVIDTDRSGGGFDGRLYLTYTDLGPGGLPNVDVFLQSSDDLGATWSPRTLVHDDVAGVGGTPASQFLPWVDVDQTSGSVHLVWYDARNDPNNKKVDVFLGSSFDGGATFEPNVRVSDGSSDQSVDNPLRWVGNYLEYIGVAVYGGTAYSVWSDNSTLPGNLDFFTDQTEIEVPAAAPGGVPASPGLELLPARPNPMETAGVIRFVLPDARQVDVSVYEPGGRRIVTLLSAGLPAATREVAWNGHDATGRRVPPGIYLYRVTAGAESASGKLTVVR